MNSLFSKVLYSTLFPAFLYAAPMHSNPWFAWRSLDYAKNQFSISDVNLNAQQCIFSNKNSSIIFNNGSRISEVDGVKVWLNVAPEMQSANVWRVAAIDLDLLSLAIQADPSEKPKKLKVVIDAGHGGSDSGAVSRCKTLKEKDVTLDLALKTGRLLKKAGLSVYYTRTKDISLTLTQRSAVASREKADLFVSIHVNNASNTNACGIESFVLTPSGYPGTAAGSPPRGWQIGNKNDYNSNLLGFSIHKQLTDGNEAIDRGLKRQSFFVLRETYCPATLVEVGFLSNANDLKLMKSNVWRSECADKIAAGVINYCRRVNSLDKAVAAKRKREAEASQRWKEYLAAKKSKPVQQPVLVATTAEPAEPASAAITTAKPVEAMPVNEPVTKVDLNTLTSQSVQAVATNIYLTKEESGQTAQKNNEGDLKSLMDFYEKGSLN